MEKPEGSYHPVGGPLMTKQSMALESDINHVISKWITLGEVPTMQSAQASFGDFSSGDSYFECLQKVDKAERAFLNLPVELRNHCNNDPAQFLDMIYDPDRRSELVKFGLVEAPGAVTEAVEAPEEPSTVEGT